MKMEEEERKKFYQNGISEMAKDVDDLTLLQYIYYFMKTKIKAGQ